MRSLRVAILLQSPMLEMKCDNKATMDLVAREGSCKAKSSIDKLCAIKEQVFSNELKIISANARDQAADVLAKLTTRIQQATRNQLSFCNVGGVLTGEGVQTNNIWDILPDGRRGIAKFGMLFQDTDC